MKRLLIATSVLALAMGSAALAQNSKSDSSGMGSGSKILGDQSGTNPNASANMPSNMGTSNSMGNNGGNRGSNANSYPPNTTMSGTATMRSSSDVRQAQSELKQQGLYQGRVDGKFGPQTRAAVSQFQRKNGLPQTASLDEQTLNGLNGASSSSPSYHSNPPIGSSNAVPQGAGMSPGAAAHPGVPNGNSNPTAPAGQPGSGRGNEATPKP